MNKTINLLCVLLAVVLLAACFACVACNKTDDTPKPQPQPTDPTLVTSFESVDDLYALTAIEIAPDDEYRLSISTDKSYVSDGNASLRYTFASGGSHLFCQYIADSHLPQLDVTKLKAVSVDFFNTSDSAQNVTLSVTTSSGAALFSKQQSILPKAKTTVVYDELATFSYKKKANVAGFSVRFDVESPVTIYVDNMRVTLGATDVAPDDFNEFVEGISNVPEQPVTGETLDQNVAFVDAVGYAKQLYNALADKSAAKSENVTKLANYEALVNGYAAVYTPRNDTDIVDKWEYGVGLTVGTDVDVGYGAVWTIAVNAKRDGQQSFRFTNIDVYGFGEVTYYVYNPNDFELRYNLHGGWQSFNAQNGKLAAKSWSKISLNAKLIENDTVGALFMIVYRMDNGVRLPFDGVFGFTALYGVPASIVAADVVAQIEALPQTDDITLADKPTVEQIRNKYDDLSKSARSAVTNYDKLAKAEQKIASVEAKAFDDAVNALPDVTADNALAVYNAVQSLYVQYENLSDIAVGLVTSIAKLRAVEAEVRTHMPRIVKDMVDNLPSASQISLPLMYDDVVLACSLFDDLTAAQQADVDKDKLAALAESASRYKELKPSFDSDKIPTAFRGYQNYYLLVYNPTSSAVEFFYQSGKDWHGCAPTQLAANAWTCIELDRAAAEYGNIYTYLGGKASNLSADGWQCRVFGFADSQADQEALAEFYGKLDGIPDVDKLTIADSDAVAAVRQAYDALSDYIKSKVDPKRLAKLTQAEEKLAQLSGEEDLRRFQDAVATLGDTSDGADVYNALWLYVNLSDGVKANVAADVKNKLDEQIVLHGMALITELDRQIEALYAVCDFPKDNATVLAMYELFKYIPSDIRKTSANKTKLGEMYNTAMSVKTVLQPDGTSQIDPTYGTVHKLYVGAEQSGSANLMFKLPKGVAANKKIVFYVYCPQGASKARLYFAVDDGSWTVKENQSVTIAQEGWIRIEFDASTVQNDYDSYWYIYTSDSTLDEQTGWLISDIYAY